MNLLHVLTDMDPRMGGVCQAVRSIIFGLKPLGVNNEVACLNNPDEPFIKEDPFKINALGQAKGPWAYQKNLLPWLLSNFHRFDIVIIHGLWQYQGYAVTKALRKFKKELKTQKEAPKLFVMPHGMLDPYFQRAKERRLKAIRNVMYWKLVEGRIINNADGLLFTCEEEQHLAKEPFNPYNPKTEYVVGLGVQQPPPFVDHMRKRFLEVCPEVQDCAYALFLSRIHEKKGVDLLIRAYAEVLRSQNSQTKFPKLVVAGPGLDSAYGKAMQALVSNLGLQTSVIFPGMLAKDTKWGAFYGAENFILPSHQENFGIAVVEALACNKTVLISNKVNIWREIEEAGGGLVADDTIPGTIQLLQRWEKLTTETKGLMNKRARKVYEEKFAIDPAAKRLLEAISN